MKNSTVVGTLCGVLLVAASAGARADIVQGTLRFEAWGFGAVNANGTPSDSVAPVSPVSGFISYRFDNTAGFMHQADGALVNGSALEISAWGLNIPWSGVLAASYLKAPPNPLGVYDTLAFSQGPTTVVDYGVDDWRLMVSSISTSPTFLQFWYSPQGEQIAYGPAIGSVQVVPEPSTAALWLVGLAALAAGARRRGRPRSSGATPRSSATA